MMTSLNKKLESIARSARNASRVVSVLSTEEKNKVLISMATALLAEKDKIIKANKKDIEGCRSRNKAFIDRLTLTENRIKQMADSLIEVSKLKDPVLDVIRSWSVPSGLKIEKVRTSIGVIAIIYESRPNVTSDCIGLCFKAGNCVILRGGSESLNSNQAIFDILNKVIISFGLPKGTINLIDTPEHKAVDYLLKLNNLIDLVIPRGGEELINKVVKSSLIPVIKHYKGICHVYVDEEADLNMAHKICLNAKIQRPGVCNAMESMLVHKDAAARFLPGILKDFKDAQVEIRGCSFTKKIAKWAKLATQKDYRTEYLDLILSVKVVDSLDSAISHINEYGSHHSDSIITDNIQAAEKFLKNVDSACVYVNASTRFTDGYQFGLGAEIGVSTDKLHARGPMALEELTTYKYMVYGNGQVRE
jgi:glutamate-5-semialdehyde dehydrogenase